MKHEGDVPYSFDIHPLEEDIYTYNYMLVVIPVMHITPERHNSHIRVTEVYLYTSLAVYKR